jgi:hypothetical protein
VYASLSRNYATVFACVGKIKFLLTLTPLES